MNSYLPFFRYSDIYIIDKGSSYPELFTYYQELKNLGVNIINSTPMENGPSGPGGLNDLYKDIEPNKSDCDYYVVTDPDIELDGCPKDMLERYADILDAENDIEIVGPMLKIDDIPDSYPAKEICLWRHVEQFWNKTPQKKKALGKTIYVQNAPIDSTFGLVRQKTKYQRLLQGYRTYFPYEAKHLDWYITPENIESDQQHYIDNSNNTVSSWGSRLLKSQPKFDKLVADQRIIQSVQRKWGKLVPYSLYLGEQGERNRFVDRNILSLIIKWLKS